MNFTDVVIVRSSPDIYDSRVKKIAHSLSKKYNVIILSWDRDGNLKPFEKIGRSIWVRRFRLKAPYGKIQLALYFPSFWLWVLVNLFIMKPKFIHVCDLDTLIPVYIYKILVKSKLIFDSFDKYSMMIAHPKYKIVSVIAEILENILAYKSDALIVASKDRLITYGRFLPKFIEVIMNCPEDTLIKRKKPRLAIELRKKPNELVLVYAGAIARDRGLLILKEAIRCLKDICLIIAGRNLDGTLKELVQEPNIRYVGILPYEDVLSLEAQADVIPVLYDPSTPINRMANPNKLFEAMMLGKPVITSVCKNIVKECRCGLIVEYNVDSVRKAILLLKNDDVLRKKLGTAGYTAFKWKYNWKYMEQKLLRLYEKLKLIN